MHRVALHHFAVMPAQAGIHGGGGACAWAPAFAGATVGAAGGMATG